MSDEPLIQRIADRLAPKVRREFLAAVDRIRGRVDFGALADALEGRDATAATVATRLDELGPELADIATILRQGFMAAGEATAGELAAVGISTRFDIVNPSAVAWARQHGAHLIVNITEESRQAVREIIADAFTEGLAPRDAARLIQAVVGLDERRARATAAFRSQLVDDGVALDAVEQRVGRYARAQLRDRARVIASHETLVASSAGQHEAWRAARDQGFLDPERTRRVWIVTGDGRLCNLCEPMADQERTLETPFTRGDGVAVVRPPSHVRCRCTTGLRL